MRAACGRHTLPAAGETMSPQSSPEALSSRVPASLEEALVKLRHDDHQLHFGHDDHPWCWDLGQGLGITLLRTPMRDAPARLAATATASATALPDACFQSTPSLPPPPPPTAATNPTGNHTGQPVALCDFLARRLHAAIAAASPAASSHGIRSDYDSEAVGQFVLETNRAAVSAATGAVSVVFEILPARGGGGGGARQLCGGAQEQQQDRGRGAEMAEVLRGIVKQALLGSVHPGGGLDAAAARAHVESVEDQRHLRRLVAASDGVAFVADGCVLPRRGGSDDRPMEISRGAVPFRSPESLRREFRLPHRGVVKGMLVPRGVTVIVGGGYHGKSTLLRALAVGVYDKVPGDGRELAVADPGAVTIRAEDGRPVSAVDISPFISSLPSAVLAPPVRAAPAGGVASAASSESIAAAGGGGAVGGAGGGTAETNDGSGSGSGGGGEGVTTERFSTGAASGSTSQAANVVEALEAGATALLLDEDTCAGNFMIRDSRMRAMVSHEPITPFIYRVSSLWLELGVSSVIVVGGCGDYFDVHDTALLVDNYLVSDATERAHSISRRFCVGRVQYAGRGLVHRLPWPGDPQPRAIVPESVLPRLAAAVGAGSNVKRKREGDGRGDDGGVEVVEEISDSVGDGWRRQIDSTSNGDRSYDESTIAGNNKGGRCNPGPPQAEDVCPCYCGRGQRGESKGPPADLSRVGQLVGGGGMERGCALGVDFVARATERSPGFLSVSGALDVLDAATGCGGGRGSDGGLGLEALFVRDTGVAAEGRDTQQATGAEAATVNSILGGPLVALPRRFEVAAALHRFPEVQFRSAAPVTPEDDRGETVPTEGVEEGEAT